MAFALHLREFFLLILLILTLPLLGAFTIFLKIKKYLQNEVQNSKNITGEVAVITGSARGLGRDIAIELAKRGCRIAVVDIRDELAQKTAEYLTKTYGVQAKAYKVDVSDYQQLVELQHNVTKDLGHTTILVNNAAILLLPLEPKPEEIRKLINVNFTAVYFANHIFLPKMKELKRGYILTISSVGAFLPCIQYDAYLACKSAVRTLMAALRVDLLNKYKNIKLTTVMPFFMTSNKLVEELMNFSFVPTLFPFVESQTAARIAVEGMLNGEEELTIPGFFLYFYKIKELLPAAVSDRVFEFLMRSTVGDLFERPEIHAILEKPDTLQLF